jgi:hypothetical protein
MHVNSGTGLAGRAPGKLRETRGFNPSAMLVAPHSTAQAVVIPSDRGPQRQVFVAGVGESRDLRLLLPLFASAGNRSLRMAGDTTSRRRALQAL